MASYKPYKNELSKIIKELADEYKNYARREVLPEVKDELERLYNLTYEGWSGGGDSGRSEVYNEPRTLIDLESLTVKTSGDYSATMIVRSMATSDGSAPHRLWYWLDFGTRPFTHVRTSAAFPERVRKRFIDGSGLNRGPAANNLFVRDADGRVKFTRIKAGQTRQGIEKQDLSLLIGEASSEQTYGINGLEWNIKDIEAVNPLNS